MKPKNIYVEITYLNKKIIKSDNFISKLTLNHFSLVNEQEKEQTKIRFY
jgi:hypothetical protein